MNKLALITGGSRGLGRASALAIAKRGTDIIITYRNNENAAKEIINAVQAIGQKAIALPLDTCDIDSFSAFIALLEDKLKSEFNRNHIDYLLNNAGIGLNTPFMETELGQVEQMLTIHVKGPYFLSQKLVPLLQNGGHILNVSSGLTRFCLPGFRAL